MRTCKNRALRALVSVYKWLFGVPGKGKNPTPKKVLHKFEVQESIMTLLEVHRFAV